MKVLKYLAVLALTAVKSEIITLDLVNNKKENLDEVHLKYGDFLKLVLPAQPSTGYEWIFSQEICGLNDMIMFDISERKKETVRSGCVEKGSALFAYDAFFENKEGGGNTR